MHSADYAVPRYLSVRLSVWHTPVLSVNGYTYMYICNVIECNVWCSTRSQCLCQARTFVRYQLVNVILWQWMNRFQCKLAHVVPGQGYAMVIFGAHEVKGQGRRRPKLDLEAWRKKNHSWTIESSKYKHTISDWNVVPEKVGGCGCTQCFICPCMAGMRLADALVFCYCDIVHCFVTVLSLSNRWWLHFNKISYFDSE